MPGASAASAVPAAPPRVFIALPDRNTRANDWAGAFRPEAERLLRMHNGNAELVMIDISLTKEERRAQLAAALRQAGDAQALDLVALLCHGWQDGISLGWHRDQARELATLLAGACRRGAAVVLYACTTATTESDVEAGTSCGPLSRGTRGFAELLWEALRCCVLQDGAPGESMHLDAHDRSGHTTSNPYVRRFDASGEAWLVDPSSPYWPAWERELHDRLTSTLRLDYPLLTRDQVEAWLRVHYRIERP